MNSHDVNKLIEDALSANAASDGFKEHVLADSTAALKRGRVLQRRLRAAGLTSMILLVAAAAFLCGRLSVPGEVAGRQMVTQSADVQEDGVRVSRDLVTWLDAARFFTQLGMDERAALSYRQASRLIPYDVLTNQQAGFEAQNVLAGISPDHDDEVLGKIIAQNFGG
jgi:hypothetical protein